MEFDAKMARKIMLERDEIKNGKKYAELKEELFSSIRNVALEGCDNLFVEWNLSASFKTYLAIKLMALGYKIKINDNIIEISWEERK